MSGPDQSMAGVRSSMQVGAAWMVSFKLLDRGLGVLSTLILARLLVPADFGIVAMAMSVVALLELFSSFGLDAALIRNQESSKVALDTAWTLNLIIGASVALGIIALSPLAATYYHEERLLMALPVLALGSLVQGAENIGVVAFRRELNFRAEFRFLLAKRLVTFLTVIPLAILYRSWWALIAGTVVGRISGVAVSYLVHAYRPRLSLAAWRQFVHFSKWVVLVNIFGYFLQRSADLVVGRLAGARALGLYTIGSELGNLPTTELIAPINRAVFPAYARIAANAELLRQEYLAVIGQIAMVGVPAAVGIVATARFFVPALLGERWLEAIPIVELFGLFGATQILQTNIYAVYLAIGKPRLQLIIHALQLALLGALLIGLTRSGGAQGAALAAFLSGFAVLPVNLWVVFRQLGVRIGMFAAIMWRPVVSAALMYCVIRVVFGHETPASTGVAIAWTLLSVSLGAVVYGLSVLALWHIAGRAAGAESDMVAGVRKILLAITRRLRAHGG